MMYNDTYTRDSISLRGAGVITVIQPKKGTRFSLDSLLLADFCRVKAWDRVLEPGAGTGLISLLLAKKYPRSHVAAVEIQASAVKYCRRNIVENGLEERIVLLEHDLRTLKKVLKSGSFDVIVANPPYTQTGTGRQSPDSGRLSSRHDRLGDIAAWLDLHIFLKNKGRFAIVFPAGRTADLVLSLRARKLEPKRMRLVHPFQDKPASLVLLEAVKAAGAGLQVMPPLVAHATGGEYTPEMRKIYGLP